MTKNFKNSRSPVPTQSFGTGGFAPIAVVLIVVAVLLVGGGAYYLTKSPKVTSQSMEEGSITITSPNGGEKWEAGTTQVIKWENSPVPSFYGKGRIVLDLINTELERQEITIATPNDLDATGSYNWRIPATLNGSFIIKLWATGLGNRFDDESDKPFQITSKTSQKPKIEKINPTSGSIKPEVATDVVDNNEVKEIKIFGSGFVTAKDDIGRNRITISSEIGFVELGIISLDGKTLIIDSLPLNIEKNHSTDEKGSLEKLTPGKYEIFVSNMWGKSNSVYITLTESSIKPIVIPKGAVEGVKVSSTIPTP